MLVARVCVRVLGFIGLGLSHIFWALGLIGVCAYLYGLCPFYMGFKAIRSRLCPSGCNLVWLLAKLGFGSQMGIELFLAL